jgi:hypothetical protein
MDQKSLTNIHSKMKQKYSELTTKLLATVARKLTKEVCYPWKRRLQTLHHTRGGFSDGSG